jgi:hypothetical protein
VVQATEEEEWAKDKESVTDYIYSLDKRIFASEMYNSKVLPVSHESAAFRGRGGLFCGRVAR